mgnify:FL=1
MPPERRLSKSSILTRLVLNGFLGDFAATAVLSTAESTCRLCLQVGREIVCVAAVPSALPNTIMFTTVNTIKILPYCTIGFNKYSKGGLRCSLKVVMSNVIYQMKVYVHFL